MYLDLGIRMDETTLVIKVLIDELNSATLAHFCACEEYYRDVLTHPNVQGVEIHLYGTHTCDSAGFRALECLRALIIEQCKLSNNMTVVVIPQETGPLVTRILSYLQNQHLRLPLPQNLALAN
jgi:hypothetical protein